MLEASKRARQLRGRIDPAIPDFLLARSAPTLVGDPRPGKVHHRIKTFKPRRIKRSCTLIPRNVATCMIGCSADNAPNIMTASREEWQQRTANHSVGTAHRNAQVLAREGRMVVQIMASPRMSPREHPLQVTSHRGATEGTPDDPARQCVFDPVLKHAGDITIRQERMPVVPRTERTGFLRITEGDPRLDVVMTRHPHQGHSELLHPKSSHRSVHHGGGTLQDFDILPRRDEAVDRSGPEVPCGQIGGGSRHET